jgi:spore coat protein JC
MWSYEKKLEFPVNIKNTSPELAQMIISQYGGTYTKSYDFTSKKFAPNNRSV